MDLRKIIRTVAPIATAALAAAAAAALTGCDGKNIEIDGDNGKLLSELDLSGPPPHSVVLFGPDRVEITSADHLSIHVEGDPKEADELRFTFKDGTLGILRRSGTWSSNKGLVTVHVAMPAPRDLVMAGTGSISADTLAGDKASVTIAGTGDIATPSVTAKSLDVTIAGTGNYRAGGSADRLSLSVAGTGSATMDTLKVTHASVTVAGSGSGSFASDGTVTASILGSGSVRVHGRAQCTVSAMGSGTLTCDHGATQAPDYDAADSGDADVKSGADNDDN